MRETRWIAGRDESAPQAAQHADEKVAERAGFEPADPEKESHH